ncbi:HlyU family transcriptional regulator [Celeribacter sp.]|uniref:HlyU family transcriptional regulator n=1 Tax=Celeribacter sp. TaxID=1890673 RepID=UPI003A92B991
MAFLSKLFGSKSAPKSKSKDVEPEVYKGFLIYPEPMRAEGGYRIAARIEKVIAGETKVHNLVRADTLSSEEDARQASLHKAQIFIDQMGDGIFG